MNGENSRQDDSTGSRKSSKKGGGKKSAEDEKSPEIQEKPKPKPGDSNKVKFRNAVQIHTKPDGYNSGRQYIIQARSDEESRKIAEQLTKLSKIATEIFLAKSKFAKAQASPASFPPDIFLTVSIPFSVKAPRIVA